MVPWTGDPVPQIVVGRRLSAPADEQRSRSGYGLVRPHGSLTATVRAEPPRPATDAPGQRHGSPRAAESPQPWPPGQAPGSAAVEQPRTWSGGHPPRRARRLQLQGRRPRRSDRPALPDRRGAVLTRPAMNASRRPWHLHPHADHVTRNAPTAPPKDTRPRYGPSLLLRAHRSGPWTTALTARRSTGHQDRPSGRPPSATRACRGHAFRFCAPLGTCALQPLHRRWEQENDDHAPQLVTVTGFARDRSP